MDRVSQQHLCIELGFLTYTKSMNNVQNQILNQILNILHILNTKTTSSLGKDAVANLAML